MKAVPRLMLDVRLEDLRNKLRAADQIIEDAYDACPQATALDHLLDWINHSAMYEATRPMKKNETPSKADADSTYQAMFAPLAALEGAIALAAGGLLEAPLREAFRLLDAAHDECDSAALGAVLPDESTDENGFNKGRDLAIEMLVEGQSLSTKDTADAYRWYRSGKPQDRFVKPYLEQLDKEPRLIEGFAAVLSASLAMDPVFDAQSMRCSMAEYEGGEMGADGTETWPDNASEPAEDADEISLNTINLVSESVSEAIGIVDARIEALGSTMAIGARNLLKAAAAAMDVASATRSLEDCETASSEIAVALVVLDAVIDDTDDLALHGASRLVSMCKDHLDKAAAQCMTGSRA
ncbi:MAG: hypothetical protein H7255_02020 [Ramlibacter sp.]|nr:hypothetical protein [Ramlibacter sp.]